jgi:hypothetical protein
VWYAFPSVFFKTILLGIFDVETNPETCFFWDCFLHQKSLVIFESHSSIGLPSSGPAWNGAAPAQAVHEVCG